MSGEVVVTELIATLGAKVEEGEFADVFNLIDHLTHYFEAFVDLVAEQIKAGFETVAKVAEYGDRVAATSEKFGIAADALQELGYAAKIADSDAESMAIALKFLSKNAAEAAAKGGDAAASFKGINLKNADGSLRSVDLIFADLADKFQKMPGDASKTALALDLFGKAGADLIPMLNRGSKGIAELRAEARASGTVLDAAALQASEAWDDANNRLAFSFDGLQKTFAVPLIAKVTALFEKLRRVLGSAGIARAVGFLTSAFSRFLDVLDNVVGAFEWFIESPRLVEASLFVIASAAAGLTLAAANMGLAFVSSAVAAAAAWLAAAAPFLALGALIALIADDIWTFSEGGDSMLGRVIGWFDKIDPENNAFLAMLRAAGSLIFDLTDPEKWKRLGGAIWDWVTVPIKGLVDSMHWILDKLGIKLPSKDDFKGLKDPMGGKSFGDAFPGMPFFGNAPQQPTETIDPNKAFESAFPGFGQAPSATATSYLPALPTGATSPTAAANLGPMGGNHASTSINAPITVNVPPGADAQGTATAVRQVVREELFAHYSDANAVMM